MDPKLLTQGEYDAFCDTTDNYPTKVEDAQKIFYAAGFAGEAGEVANKVKKIYRDDDGVLTDERRNAIIKELGGCYWYFSRLCKALGTTPDEIRALNFVELESRKARGTIKGDGDDR